MATNKKKPRELDPVLEVLRHIAFGGDPAKALRLMSTEDLTRLNAAATVVRRSVEGELIARSFRDKR